MRNKGDRPLVLCAQATGYGPISKLLAIADCLDTTSGSRVFLGTGIAYELAQRSTLFDEIVDTGPTDKKARGHVARARGVLSVMDIDFARLALESGRPLFVADSLAWMRRPLPAEFLSARKYWVQNFPGLREHLTGVQPKPSIVGPIIPPLAPSTPPAEGLLVCLGGYETPYASASDDSGYLDFVAGGLFDSGLADMVKGETMVMAGAGCIERLQKTYGRSGVRFVSVSHAEAAEARARASILLTAPGLTSTVECFYARRPTFFLPPQNYSQWMILARMREAAIAPCSFHWTDRLSHRSFDGAWTTAARVPIVRNAIARVTADPEARRLYREGLTRIPAHATTDLAQKQQAYFDALGSNGAEIIAREFAAA